MTIKESFKTSDLKLAIIGLGYVGLPLALEFGRARTVVGFDINQVRVDELKSGWDRTLEADSDDLVSAKFLSFTMDVEDLRQLWYDRTLWPKIFSQPAVWDELINDFNDKTGLLKKL